MNGKAIRRAVSTRKPGTRSGGKTSTRTGGGKAARPKSKSAASKSAASKKKKAKRTTSSKPWARFVGAGSGKSATSRTRREPRAEPKEQEAPAERAAPHTAVRALAMLIAFAAMVGFAVVLSRLTLEPSAASASIAHSNLRPGDSIRAYLSQPAFQDTIKQLGGNLALGLPFGVLLPVLIPRVHGIIRVTAVTAAVMLLVELVQGALITGRAFDIDDVILNSTGALVGYLLLGRRLGRAVHPPRRRWWQRWMYGSAAN